ncbi:MAG: biotin transporter BioY [Pseudomonadota bacterium]
MAFQRQSLLHPDLTGHSRAASLMQFALIAVAGSILMTLAAKFKVPFEPVPMTLQTPLICLMGLALGARLAGSAVALYLAQGAMGLPVFAGTPEKGVGLAYMLGPTGGFLAGFLLAAVAIGWLADRGWSRSFLLATLAAFAGVAVMYAAGGVWLSGWLAMIKQVAATDALSKAVAAGIAPFLAKDLIAAVIAGLAVPLGLSMMGRR